MSKWIIDPTELEKISDEETIWLTEVILPDESKESAWYIGAGAPREAAVQEHWPEINSFKSHRTYKPDESIVPALYDTNRCGERCPYLHGTEIADKYNCSKFKLTLKASPDLAGISIPRCVACVKCLPEIPQRMVDEFNRELGVL